MKKFLTAILAAVIVLSSAFSAEAAKKVVAVMPLENISGKDTAKVAEIMTEKLMIAIQNSGKYSVVERTQMATILKEQGFQNIAANPDSAVEVGKLAGADYSLIGKVTMFNIIQDNPLNNILGDKDILNKSDEQKGISVLQGLLNQTMTANVNIEVRFVNNETGELVLAKSLTGKSTDKNSENTLIGACQDAADKFLQEITANLSGRVADTFGDDVYIDLGADSGLRTGDILSVLREIAPIEVKGKIVGMKTVPVGQIEVVEIFEEYSICKVVYVENRTDILKGDIIKRG